MDYDGDGRMDMLTGSISGRVHLFRRKPNGTFAVPETIRKEVSSFLHLSASLNVGRPSAVAMVDWDDDGDLDLFVGNGDGGVFFVPNEGTRQKPKFTRTLRLKAKSQWIMAKGGNAGPCLADWDQDGQLDLVVGSSSGAVVWYRNMGTKAHPQLADGVTLIEPLSVEQRRSDATSEKPTRSGAESKVCVADWNGDGRPDLVVGDYAPARVGGRYTTHGWVWVYLRGAAPTTAAGP